MALNTFKCNYLTPLHFKGLVTRLQLRLDLDRIKHLKVVNAIQL